MHDTVKGQHSPCYTVSSAHRMQEGMGGPGPYRIAQKFRGSKFSRIAVFENFVEIILRIHCPKHATPTLFMGVTRWNSISRALELSFIDLAAAVNTRNLEGMPTFDVQVMVRGYHVYQHVWDASIHEELPCAREAEVKQLWYLPQIWHERVLLERALLGNLDPGYCPSTLLMAENYYARVKNFVEIISRMAQNLQKFRPAKVLRYTVVDFIPGSVHHPVGQVWALHR